MICIPLFLWSVYHSKKTMYRFHLLFHSYHVFIFLLGVVAGAQLWGYVSDTKGRRLTLVLSMSIGFVFAALSSFSPNWQTMAILKLISSTL